MIKIIVQDVRIGVLLQWQLVVLITIFIILGRCSIGWAAAAKPAEVVLKQASQPLNPMAHAMNAVQAAIPQASADPNRPVYHFHAPAQWMNDPNGFSLYHGWYEVYYQFNPYGSAWGNMHWGHARSKDLVNWQQLPIALRPSHSRGEQYVYSGSVFQNSDHRPLAFYTSIASTDAPRDPQVWAAIPQDSNLIRWWKLTKEPVISEPSTGPLHIDQWRDPFLLSDQGATYLITGGGLHGRGVVCLYKALNGALTTWRYCGVLFQYPDSSVTNIECPNLLNIGGRWVLLLSVNSQVEYYTGAADLKQCQFIPYTHGVLNKGSYASQAVYDKDGRCIELAWIRPIGGPGWSGCLTLPSFLSITDTGALVSTPISALADLRTTGTTISNMPLSGTLDLSRRISGDTLEILAQINPGGASEIDFRLRASTDGTRAITIRYNVKSSTLSVPGLNDIVVPPIDANGVVDLHLFLDKSLLDVYGDGGEVTETGALSPLPQTSDQDLAVYSIGGTAHIQNLTIYRLKPAKFDMSLFY